MDSQGSHYSRTQSGDEAAGLPRSRLPAAILRLLCATGHGRHFEDIAAGLREYDRRDILARLQDLEAIGLVESVELEWLRELLELCACLEEPLGSS